MIELFQKLFLGHVHKWEIIEKRERTDGTWVIGVKYIMQCTHCGKVISKTF